MNHRIGIASALLGAIATIIASPTARADDPRADHRPCVTKREMSGRVYRYGPISRNALERRWEVLGHRINITKTISNIGSEHAYLYKACGYTLDQVQVILVTERTNRPGYDTSKTPGQRTVIGGTWWKLPPGSECGDICAPLEN